METNQEKTPRWYKGQRVKDNMLKVEGRVINDKDDNPGYPILVQFDNNEYRAYTEEGQRPAGAPVRLYPLQEKPAENASDPDSILPYLSVLTEIRDLLKAQGESLEKLAESKETERILEKARKEAEKSEEPKPGDWGWFWDDDEEDSAEFGVLEEMQDAISFVYKKRRGMGFQNFSSIPPKPLVDQLAKAGYKLEKL